MPPCSIAAIVGASPAQPTIAATVRSAARAAASTSAARAARRRDAAAGERLAQLGQAALVGRPPPARRRTRAPAWPAPPPGNSRSARRRATRRGCGGSGRASRRRSSRSRRGWRAMRVISSTMPSASSADDDRHRQQPVDPVEHAAMAGDQARGVLHPRPALQPAFEEVARLRERPPARRRAAQPTPSVLRRSGRPSSNRGPAIAAVDRDDPQHAATAPRRPSRRTGRPRSSTG